jgi:hypothetical protein
VLSGRPPRAIVSRTFCSHKTADISGIPPAMRASESVTGSCSDPAGLGRWAKEIEASGLGRADGRLSALI